MVQSDAASLELLSKTRDDTFGEVGTTLKCHVEKVNPQEGGGGLLDIHT